MFPGAEQPLELFNWLAHLLGCVMPGPDVAHASSGSGEESGNGLAMLLFIVGAILFLANKDSIFESAGMGPPQRERREEENPDHRRQREEEREREAERLREAQRQHEIEAERILSERANNVRMGALDADPLPDIEFNFENLNIDPLPQDNAGNSYPNDVPSNRNGHNRSN